MVDLMSLSSCPLDGVWTTGNFGRPGTTGLTMERTTPISLVQLSLFPNDALKVPAKLKKIGIKEFPANGMSHVEQTLSVLSLGAGRYLLESTDPEFFSKVQKAVPAEVGSTTDLSSARIVFTIAGPAVETVLQKGIAMDFSLDAFPIGKVAQTTAHHLNVTVLRTDVEQFRISAFSTFARSAFDWLNVSSLPHGLQRN